MLSNRTANFKVNENEEEKNEIKNNNEQFIKQLTSPLPKFDINFYFSNEDDKEMSSFSFKHDLLDKKAYDFIKTKEECLSKMELDDTVPDKNDEKENEHKRKKNSIKSI